MTTDRGAGRGRGQLRVQSEALRRCRRGQPASRYSSTTCRSPWSGSRRLNFSASIPRRLRHLPSAARQRIAGSRPAVRLSARGLSRPELLLDTDHGPVASRGQPGSSAGRAGAVVSAMGGQHSGQRPGARESSRAGGQRRRGRAGQPAPAVLATAVRADGAGGIDPGLGLRQCSEPVAGARRCAQARNRATA